MYFFRTGLLKILFISNCLSHFNKLASGTEQRLHLRKYIHPLAVVCNEMKPKPIIYSKAPHTIPWFTLTTSHAPFSPLTAHRSSYITSFYPMHASYSPDYSDPNTLRDSFTWSMGNWCKQISSQISNDGKSHYHIM